MISKYSLIIHSLLTVIFLFSCNVDSNLEVTKDNTSLLSQTFNTTTTTPAPMMAMRPPTAYEAEMLREQFPLLNLNVVLVTDEATPAYNCIGFAIGVHDWINTSTLLEDFLIEMENARELYNAPNNYWEASGSPVIDVWGHYPIVAHASKFGHMGWESKLGRSIRILHDRHGLRGLLYGHVIKTLTYLYTHPKTNTIQSLNEVYNIKESLSNEHITSVEALSLKTPLLTRLKFEKAFNIWKEDWRTNPKTLFSSNTNDARRLDSYAPLKAMGKEILPLLIKELTNKENFFALVLYDDLQDDTTQKIDYTAPEYRKHILEGEQGRAVRTIKLWLSKQ